MLPRPSYQTAIYAVGAALTGLLALGEVLHAVHAANALVSPAFTYVASAALACLGLGAIFILPRNPLPWRLGERQIRIRRLGPGILGALIGMLVLLWIPRLPLQKEIPAPAFRIAPGPGTSEVVFATTTGLDMELLEAAAQQARAARDSFNKGTRHFEVGQYRQAATDYQQSLQAMPTLSAILNLALSLRYIPDYRAAEPVLRTGLQRASEQHREQFEAHFSLYLSSVLLNQDKYDEAEPYIAKALQIYERLGDTLGQANSHLNFGILLLNRRRTPEAINQWQMALDAFSRANNTLGRANVQFCLGTVNGDNLQLGEAARFFRSALSAYKTIGNLSGVARASNGLAQIDVLTGRLVEALAISRQALDTAVLQGNQQERAAALSTIGVTLDEQGRFNEAVLVELKALQLSRELGDRDQEAWANYYLSSSYRQLGRFRDADDHATRAIALTEQGMDPTLLAVAWTELGLAYVSQRRFDKATGAFQKARAVAGANELSRAYTLANLGTLEAMLGHNQRALALLSTANATYTKTGVRLRSALEAKQLIERLQHPSRRP